MANQVEIIVRAVDEASKVLQDVEANATKSLGGAAEAGAAMGVSFALTTKMIEGLTNGALGLFIHQLLPRGRPGRSTMCS